MTMVQFIIPLCIAVAILAGQSYQRSPPGPPFVLDSSCKDSPWIVWRNSKCEDCKCISEDGYYCTSAGPRYKDYPNTCKVVLDMFRCEKLVFKDRPWLKCTDGPVKAIL